MNDPEACVLRELFEETGIKPENICNLKLKYISLRQRTGEIRQNYYFFAELKSKNLALPPCNEGILEWVDMAEVLERDMPFSAFFALKHYLQTGKNTNLKYAGISTESGVDFVALTEF